MNFLTHSEAARSCRADRRAPLAESSSPVKSSPPARDRYRQKSDTSVTATATASAPPPPPPAPPPPSALTLSSESLIARRRDSHPTPTTTDSRQPTFRSVSQPIDVVTARRHTQLMSFVQFSIGKYCSNSFSNFFNILSILFYMCYLKYY